LLYAIVLLLFVVPTFRMVDCGFGWRYPPAVGLPIRITPLDTLATEIQPERLVVRVGSSERPAKGAPLLRLNSRPVSRSDLRTEVRAALSRRGAAVVYVNCLEFGDVVPVIDVRREAWYGVTIVLMTPARKDR
jgi:hypothetical protein